MRRPSRGLLVAAMTIALVLGAVAFVWAFGGPRAAPDPSSPLAVGIPGCVCHSDDPDVVAEHERYRMNQCFGCHEDGMPGMAR